MKKGAEPQGKMKENSSRKAGKAPSKNEEKFIKKGQSADCFICFFTFQGLDHQMRATAPFVIYLSTLSTFSLQPAPLRIPSPNFPKPKLCVYIQPPI